MTQRTHFLESLINDESEKRMADRNSHQMQLKQMQDNILELEKQNEKLLDSIALVRDKKSVFITKTIDWSYVNQGPS